MVGEWTRSRFVTATGLVPTYSSRQALQEFVDLAPAGLLSADRINYVLTSLNDLVAERRA